MDEYHLLGVIGLMSDLGPLPEGTQPELLLYRSKDRKVAIVEGYRPHDGGAVLDLAEWFALPPFLSPVAGDVVPRLMSEGRFEHICKQADCEWFLPIAKRIAAGEPVSLDEITNEFSLRHRGNSMPHDTVGGLFRFLATPRYEPGT